MRLLIVPALRDDPLQPGAQLPLASEDSHRLRRVLRLREGAPLLIGDGAGRAVHATLGASASTVALQGPVQAAPQPPRHTLIAPLLKGDRWLWLLEKATELGVATIVPLVSDHSVVRPPDKRMDKQHARWLERLRAACEQCGRWTLPELSAPVDLATALASLPQGTVVAYGDARASSAVGGPARDPRCAASDLRSLAAAEHGLACCIGPEGGWSEAERALFAAQAAHAVCLGSYVLRAETAAIAAAAQLASADEATR